VRFNDLDNIGITGRHYSGFVMLGIQVFNYPNDYKFFKDECVEFNFRWLTETLHIPPDEITFIEDVWAGGGNLGPSIEYFVRGLEVGNMVFMQYKTFHDGSREELDIKVIDTGIGLERVAWLVNGSPTSYMDTFSNAYAYLLAQLGLTVQEDIWEKYGPFSCTLNIDEVDDIEQAWADISAKIGVPVAEVKQAIQPIKDLYIVLDHTRTIMITVCDGSLPSNVGGGGNVRNILRRTFSILKRNGWWDKLGMEGFLGIFDHHKRDLEGIFGAFPEYKSFEQIIRVEYDRWRSSDEESVKKVEKLLK
jgi:alanyl-tRNA synthetase